jgi:hypothetical protein
VVQRDIVFGIPVERVQENFARVLRAVQHIREQDAIVVAVRLGAQHRDVKLFATAARQNLFHRARARHAVADNHQLLLFHCSSPAITSTSSTLARRTAGSSAPRIL